MGPMKVILIAILLLIIIGVVASASVKIVDAGNRGVLLHWNAVDLTAPPLDEGIHFVIPFQDDIVQLEVRTLKYDAETRSASKDLQTVETTVTVNYNPDKERVHILYKEIGLDYENRVIQPAIEETVKQVTANYNAEELITKRPLVKADIENAIRERLNQFNIVTTVISITDFEFSPLFASAIESKVEAEQKAKKAESRK
jgi:regulator of protease activity HflC (stomatin/prohibitin superfamily)